MASCAPRHRQVGMAPQCPSHSARDCPLQSRNRPDMVGVFAVTNDQITLLEDKLNLWREASKTGTFELRDYYRRCADALEQCLHEAIEGRA